MNKQQTQFNIEGFKQICRAPQSQLKEYLEGVVNGVFKTTRITRDYVLGVGELPVLLVAHMDTVHEKMSLPETIVYDPTEKGGIVWSPQGIGGDDRCGIYIILSLLAKSDKKPSVLFTTDEEIGCLGASKAKNDIPKDIYSNFKFIIQLDRRGEKDCVFYGCNNTEFKNYIESFGFVTATGSRSDISELCPKWDIAGVNLSVGYVKEHTKEEAVYVRNLLSTIDKVQDILKDCEKAKKYDYGSSLLYNRGKKRNQGKSAVFFAQRLNIDIKYEYEDDPFFDPYFKK